MNAELSRACPSCKRLTGRLCRLLPEEPATYRALQRCDLCGHRWTTIITMESDRLPSQASRHSSGGLDREAMATVTMGVAIALNSSIRAPIGDG